MVSILFLQTPIECTYDREHVWSSREAAVSGYDAKSSKSPKAVA
jgi:hypothetical protein